MGPPTLPAYDPSEAPESLHPWLDDPDTPTFLTTSRLVPLKRIDILIEALIIARLNAPAKLLVIGKGPDRQRLVELVGAAGLEDAVEFLGWVPEPRYLMAKATAFVLASDEEGFGMVLGEAVSTGCPVITTDARGGGPAFVTENGTSGLLVPRGAVEELSKAMLATIQDEARNDLSGKALARAADFTPEHNAERLLDFLERLSGQARPKPRIARSA